MDEILYRRSIRKYDLTRNIPYDKVYELCKYGEAAPSAKNQRSREYIIVDDKELIDKLALISKGTMLLNECNHLIVVVGKNPSDLARPQMQAQDLSAATENILIAAAKMKIGSCWCGVYPLENEMKAVNEALNISEGKFAFSIIALGYPLNEADFKDKNKFSDDLVFHNRG